VDIVPAYCFNPDLYKQGQYQTLKCGVVRTKFNLESVLELRTRLESIGSCLLVDFCEPREMISKLLVEDTTIVYQREAYDEEMG